MSIVNFIIVGAAKSGTTSLYQYISQHQNVFMPQNKEPRFFCDYPVEKFNFDSNYFHSEITKSKEQYMELFVDAPKNAFCGEASTDYLTCKNTAQRIYDWDKNIKIIIMLRDPIERAYSEYLHSFNAKFQRESFWESLMLEKKRQNELYDPIFHHVTRGLYYHPVKEYLKLLDTEIIFFEDFANNSQQVTQDTLTFLKLQEQSIDTSSKFNVGTNSYYKQRPLTLAQHEWLKDQFKVDVLNLQSLLGKDLSHWLK